MPQGDDRLRHICDECGRIHYLNPKVIAGCIPVWEGRILLCRRAIEPRKGYWTLPAGFMEQGETLAEAARREAWEEANVRVDTGDLYTLFSLPHLSQVYVFFQARMVDGRFSPGDESLETRLFAEDEIPWREISFETVYRSLHYFFADRKQGEFVLRTEDIGPNDPRMLDDAPGAS
ncbi:NUDIX hydrolase [Methylococcus sp. EFPC2]|uniref:NUDIX hydrolase n=1 Tax=Methylococcus sp. EFPC2 TaxID=2812648 RepID=UPI001F07F961|nr:NUDIX hydrolase [Methylococcus sp. EFPC2]